MLYSIPISIIMPCYNYGNYVSKAIKSILEQSFTDFEFIIINDGSTDNSDEEIRKHTDARIKYVCLPENKGNYVARNTGLKMAAGKYVCVMDADDIAYPHRLETQYAFMERHPYVGCCGSQAVRMDEYDKEIIPMRHPIKNAHLKVFLLKNIFLFHPSLMVRRRLLIKHAILYNETLQYAADYDLIARCANLFPVQNINENLIKYRRHDQQISCQKKQQQMQTVNYVRLWQLKRFGVNVTEEQERIYLAMMSDQYITPDQLQIGLGLLNTLLERNAELKLYNQQQLYKLFDRTILSAQQKSALGGWAIEQQVVNFIQKQLPAGKSILEFGTGIGTEALLRNYHVTSIEHNKRFAYSRSVDHQCHHAPIIDGWYDSAIVCDALKKSFDLLLVDGPPMQLRQGILNHLECFQQLHCPIIFDDMQREPDKEVMIKFCNVLNYQHQIIQGDKKQFAYCVKQS